MLKYIYSPIILFIIWISFSGIFNKFLLICSFVSIVLSVIILDYLGFLSKLKISILGVKYLIRLFYDIFKSSIILSIKIWKENIEIKSMFGIVKFSNLANSINATMHANSIAMTPGTIVVGINKNEMLVHFIDKNEYSELQNQDYFNIIDKK